MGTEAGEFRARRRWLSSSRTAPGGGKGVLEDRGGLPAGALAAAYTLGGSVLVIVLQDFLKFFFEVETELKIMKDVWLWV